VNKAVIIGNLTRDPDLRTTSNTGTSVCSFTVAVQRRRSRTNPNPNAPEADFIPVVVWREQAENCARYLRKGSQVGVSGSIQVRSYDAQDGTRRYVTEIIADEVKFLSRPSSTGDSGASRGDYSAPQAPLLEEIDDELPF
jgi:single-strand DNA-binding protein